MPLFENITVVFQAENIIMTVNILDGLTVILTMSKQDVIFVAHVDWYSLQLLQSCSLA